MPPHRKDPRSRPLYLGVLEVVPSGFSCMYARAGHRPVSQANADNVPHMEADVCEDPHVLSVHTIPGLTRHTEVLAAGVE